MICTHKIKITDICLSSVSRTKTRDKIATRCSTPCSKKKKNSGKRGNLIYIDVYIYNMKDDKQIELLYRNYDHLKIG